MWDSTNTVIKSYMSCIRLYISRLFTPDDGRVIRNTMCVSDKIEL